MKRHGTRRWQGMRILLLAALFYRALIPLGYMPAMSAAPLPGMAAMHHGGWLMLCPGGTLQQNGHGGLIERQCFFGMAAAPTLPGAVVLLADDLPKPFAAPPPSSTERRAIVSVLRPPVRGPPQLS